MAKGIGNGFPLAAVVTTPEIAAKLGQALGCVVTSSVEDCHVNSLLQDLA